MMSALVHLIVRDHDQTLLIMCIIRHCRTIDILGLLTCLMALLFRVVAGRIFRSDVVAGGCSGEHTSFRSVGGVSNAA
jgi:hypothetical protein